ncbi:hypothetical protein [Methylophaga sp.]|jgi:hypothetical protein|uniref:hypothetical protein n=1 Tax=Methylophaga sp. TaxID=2024840 RepID=UPI0025CDEC92|nr:hypothetical protein [Methylophaga sp.]
MTAHHSVQSFTDAQAHFHYYRGHQDHDPAAVYGEGDHDSLLERIKPPVPAASSIF